MNDLIKPEIKYNSFVFSVLEYPMQEIIPGKPTQLKISISGLLNNKNVAYETIEDLRLIEEMKNKNFPWKQIKIKEMLFKIIDDGLKNGVIQYE